MSKSEFGQRLKSAFEHATNAVIGSKIGVAEGTVGFYVRGRVPDADILLKIQDTTHCNLHWLLTGEGEPQHGSSGELPGVRSKLLDKLRTIAQEQAQIVYGDLDIAADNLEEKTLELLIDYLLHRALASFNLIDDGDIPAATRRAAEKFTFVANLPHSLDDRVRELVKQEMEKRDAEKRDAETRGRGDAVTEKRRRA